MMKIAFLGLGVMGAPMAGFLAKSKKYNVCVCNRTTQKAKNWCKQYGGHFAETPFEAAREADFVMACVGDDPDVEAICVGDDGAFGSMKKNSIFIDHTTTSAKLARRLHQKAQTLEIGFIDAPVSGGQSGAENGILTIMCGGDQKHFEQAKPYMDHYSRMCRLLGGPGSGQIAKMVNQICIAGLVQALSEGIAFGKKSNLDIAALLDVLSKGAAQSWQMENRGYTMDEGQFDFGFAVDWMRKDLRICLDQARDCNANLPVTALIDQFYAKLQQNGDGRLDTSSLIKLL
ncbi:MAG: NAD(P)-dependent oxidoreductase [Pseudomonadota bacterium]